MKLSKLFMISALLAPWLASCNSETDISVGPTPGKDEFQLVFNGGSDGEIYTRGIATDSENEIRELRVYVFASDTEGGTYYFQEMFSTEADAADDAHRFQLQGTGVSKQASIRPSEWKTMPYLKFCCVANSKVYTDGTAEPTLTAITGDADGVPTTGAATTETAFKAFVTAAVGTATPISTPLAMKGEGKTKISGNYSKVSIELKRVVARFDIENDAAKTALTITKISVMKAHPYATLFDTPTGIGTLASYPSVDYTQLPSANAGISTGAIYMNPSAKANESLLVIEGTFLNPGNKVETPVSYRVPIAKNPSTPVAGGSVEYIDVMPNTRYTMHISQVTEAEITAMFEIEDWTSSGGVDIKPNNDVAPEVLTVTGTTWTAPAKHLSVTADGEIVLTVKATGKVRADLATIGGIITRAGENDWLVATAGYTPEYAEVGGQTQTTLKFTVAGIADAITPVEVTLINDAASNDPDLHTVLTIIPPTTAPLLQTSATHTSSSYNVLDATAKTATIYKGTDSKIYFDAICPFGSTVTSDKADLKITKVSTQGLVETYSIAFANPATTETIANITIANKDNNAKTTVIATTISDGNIVKADITAAEATYTAADDKFVINAAPAGTITLTIPSVAGVKLAVTDYTWFSVARTQAWANTDATTKKDVYTFTLKPGKTMTETSLTFVNEVKGNDNLVVKVSQATAP